MRNDADTPLIEMSSRIMLLKAILHAAQLLFFGPRAQSRLQALNIKS